MTSRKKKLHRRKLESDEEDEPRQIAPAEETPDPENNVDGDEEIIDGQAIQNLSIEQLQAQIAEAEAKLAETKATEQTGPGRKRDAKAASKAGSATLLDQSKKPAETSHPLLAAMQKTQNRRKKTELSTE